MILSLSLYLQMEIKMKKRSGIKDINTISASEPGTARPDEGGEAMIALINTREYLADIINTMTEPVFIKDEAHRWILINDAYCRLTGYSRDQLLGKSDHDFYKQEEAKEFWNKDTLVLETGRENCNDEPFTDASGTLHTIRTRKSRFVDAAGRKFIVGIITDITLQKRFEEALTESEEKFRSLFDSAMAVICVLEPGSLKILEINQSALQFYGYTREELLEMTALDISADPDTTRRLLELDNRNYVPVRYHRKKDGALVPVEIKTIPFTMNGKTVILTLIHDITARLEAEEALRESEARHRFMAENASDIIARHGMDLRVLYVSPSTKTILGYEPDELAGIESLALVHPDDIPFMKKKAEELLNSNDTKVFSYRIRRKDGTYTWMESSARVVRDNKTGEPVEILDVARDIRERMKAEDEMKIALRKEKQLVDLKSRFISMTSHEFGTPLCAILSTLELLENYGDKLTDEKKAHYLRQASSSARYMVDLLQDVILMGKFNVGKVKSNPMPLNIKKLNQAIIEEIKLTLSDKHLFSYSVEGRIKKIKLDEDLYRCVLSNLLSNAVKYSPQGGKIDFRFSFNKSSLILEISDTGIGIPEEDREMLYEMFHRGSNIKNIPGTGLGMSIIKRSIDMMGGTISFKTALGEGSEFTVTIPLGS